MTESIKVCLATPTAGHVQAVYAYSLLGMALHFLQNPIMGQEGKHREIVYSMITSSNIGESRDHMVDAAIRTNCTHLLFMDDDMGFTDDTLSIALTRQQPMVIANYRRKAPPGLFTARNKDNTACIETTPESTSLEECAFGGFGFCLIERQVFTAIKRPRFLMKYDSEKHFYSTEDVPFFQAVHEAGFKTYVDHEVSKRVWHCGLFHYGIDVDLKREYAEPYPLRLLKQIDEERAKFQPIEDDEKAA